ncbi:hypothetical protein [Paramuribaculum intestinale]
MEAPCPIRVASEAPSAPNIYHTAPSGDVAVALSPSAPSVTHAWLRPLDG